MEIDIDVAKGFSYVAQRGVCWMLGTADKLIADIAFVLEGREEDLLPECPLGEFADGGTVGRAVWVYDGRTVLARG